MLESVRISCLFLICKLLVKEFIWDSEGVICCSSGHELN